MRYREENRKKTRFHFALMLSAFRVPEMETDKNWVKENYMNYKVINDCGKEMKSKKIAPF